MKKLILGLALIPTLYHAMDTDPSRPLRPLSEQFSWRDFDDNQKTEMGLPLFKQLLVHAWKQADMCQSSGLTELLHRIRTKEITVWRGGPFEPKELENKVILSKKDVFNRLLFYVAHNGVVLESLPPQYPVELNGKKVNLCASYDKTTTEPNTLFTFVKLEQPAWLEQKYNEILPS